MITNAYKAIGTEKSKEEYDEKELENSGYLQFGGKIYKSQNFIL